jgi:hypothetical protein
MVSAKLLRKFPYVRNPDSDDKPLVASTAIGARANSAAGVQPPMCGIVGCSLNRRSFCAGIGPRRTIEISQEDQKDKRRELGVRAAAGDRVLRCAPKARRAIKPSDLLPFL